MFLGGAGAVLTLPTSILYLAPAALLGWHCWRKRPFPCLPLKIVLAAGAVLTAAHHLWQWMRRNRFCGGCDRSVGYVLFPGLFQKGFGGECESVGELQFLDQQNVVVARSGAERKTRMSLRR